MATDRGNNDAGADTIYVPFSREAYEDLMRYSSESDVAPARFIQEALAVNRKLRAIKFEGGKVIVEAGGKRRELVVK